MKTFDIHDPQNRVLAFEIGNTFVGRRRACRIAASIPGAQLIRTPKALSWLRESSFCEFVVDGNRFEIEEPFGDSNRYWIGPVPPVFTPAIEKVRNAFVAA